MARFRGTGPLPRGWLVGFEPALLGHLSRQAERDALVHEHLVLKGGTLAAQAVHDLGNDVFWR